jgi:O-antigen/teichoic acid export membrane protein
MTLSQNINPNKNPWTTVTGTLFIILSLVMYVVKYLVPLFVTLKQPVDYADYIPAIMIFIGLVLLFMSDNLFERIFNAVLNVFKKKTDTQ